MTSEDTESSIFECTKQVAANSVGKRRRTTASQDEDDDDQLHYRLRREVDVETNENAALLSDHVVINSCNVLISDLKAESISFISINGGGFRDSSVICSETEQANDQEVTSRRKALATETLYAAEIEEFFSKAEQYHQKRFAEKYNYDIVKDVPMKKGSYQWVPLLNPY